MKTKEEIVANWLPRYTKRKLEDFGEYILLTNFNKYVEIFAERFNVPILGRDANMISAQIGSASCREKCTSWCRSRWSPYH